MALFDFKKGKQASLKRKKLERNQEHLMEQRRPVRAPAPAAKQASKNLGKYIVYAIVAVIVIAIAAYFLTSMNVGQTMVSGTATENITPSGIIFNINSQQYLVSLSGLSVGSAKAYVHVSKLPIFLNPVLNVTLALGNITKVNSGSNYANIGLKLDSMSANSVTVSITVLQTSLGIAPDYQDIRVVQGTLYGYGQAPAPSGPGAQATTSTTLITTTTAGAATTSATTTVVPSVNSTLLDVNAALRQNSLYAVLYNFSILYANTTRCTPTIYNSTYIFVNGHAPSGGSTFMNVSPYVPYNLSINTGGAGGGNFNVVFKTKTVDPVFNNIVAATIKVNASIKATLSENISSTGIFSGVNQSQLYKNYVRALGAGGPCGVEV